MEDAEKEELKQQLNQIYATLKSMEEELGRINERLGSIVVRLRKEEKK